RQRRAEPAPAPRRRGRAVRPGTSRPQALPMGVDPALQPGAPVPPGASQVIPPAAVRVQTALRALGVEGDVIVLAESARTAAQAAAACGVAVGQIIKSLVFLAGDEPILVLVSGANQADERRLGELSGQTVRRADADSVRGST